MVRLIGGYPLCRNFAGSLVFEFLVDYLNGFHEGFSQHVPKGRYINIKVTGSGRDFFHVLGGVIVLDFLLLDFLKYRNLEDWKPFL